MGSCHNGKAIDESWNFKNVLGVHPSFAFPSPPSPWILEQCFSWLLSLPLCSPQSSLLTSARDPFTKHRFHPVVSLLQFLFRLLSLASQVWPYLSSLNHLSLTFQSVWHHTCHKSEPCLFTSPSYLTWDITVVPSQLLPCWRISPNHANSNSSMLPFPTIMVSMDFFLLEIMYHFQLCTMGTIIDIFILFQVELTHPIRKWSFRLHLFWHRSSVVST